MGDTTHGHLAHDAFHVADVLEVFGNDVGTLRVLEEIFDHRVTVTDLLQMDKREEQPAVHHTTTHRSDGVVQNTEQRPSALVHRCHQFEAADGELIQTHI